MTVGDPRPAIVDGRSARSERTRRRIVDAHLDLISEGNLRARPEHIVARAGVSLRTLWTNFKDIESLHFALNERLMQRLDAQYRMVRVDTALPQRVVEFSEQRGRLLDILAPAARAVQARVPTPALREARSGHHRRSRTEIEYVFARELAVAGPRREELTRALLTMTSSAAWAVLRDELGLDLSTSTEVLARTVAALLAGYR